MPRKYTKDDIDKFHDYEIWLPDNILYIGSNSYIEDYESGVDHAMAERVIKNLHILDRTINNELGIQIKMNNPGGYVYHGLAIYDAILTCNNSVSITAYGHVMSMGSLIFQAADTRIMSPNSRMMIHFGQSTVSGHLLDIYKTVDELKEIDKIINNIYLKRIKEVKPRFTLEEFKEMIKFDCYLSAKEAIELGLCDKILGEE
jgi:ATP-dependent Clp protease protease subunit